MARSSFPLLDLRDVRVEALRTEVLGGLAALVMGVPQGVAYAMIAGLPPVMGLYAGALPALVGALLRSSPHTHIGPTNAVALLVATSAVATSPHPATAALTLALLIGAMQLLAVALRLYTLAEFLSQAVVSGYITGAATLILVGQLPLLSGSPGGSGDIVSRLAGWASGLGQVQPLAVSVGLVAAAAILLLRVRLPRGLPALIAVFGAALVNWALGLDAYGLQRVADLQPVPAGWPAFTLPSLTGTFALLSGAAAAAVLGLVESTAISRSLAHQAGVRIDPRWDLAGLGAANLAAAFTGAMPVSGSLSRSALAFQLGSRSRVSGLVAGLGTLVVLLAAGPVVDWVPLPALAALVVIAAVDLIDLGILRDVWRGSGADRGALAGTILGTWFLPLDQAIYLGVGISLALFLRRARLLLIRDLGIDADGRLQEVEPGQDRSALRFCSSIAVVHVEGPLFFGAASELESALDERADDPAVQVLVVRLKRVTTLDYTAGQVLARLHDRMEKLGKHLILVGMRPDVMQRLRDMGVTEAFRDSELFPTEPGWFTAMNHALSEAMSRLSPETCAASVGCCPLKLYLDRREETPRSER